MSVTVILTSVSTTALFVVANVYALPFASVNLNSTSAFLTFWSTSIVAFGAFTNSTSATASACTLTFRVAFASLPYLTITL